MRMDINAMNDAFDSFREGTKEIAEIAHTKTKEFHENYISKVLPDCGKYGDAVKFAAEMLPGVSEYNAIRDGDWKSFAISAGIDAAGIALGSFSVGAGYAAVKGGSTGAKKSLKVAVKEISEAGTKKIAKETVEAGTEKTIKETVEAGTEKIAKEVVGDGTERVIRETAEEGAEKVIREVVKGGADKTVQRTANRKIIYRYMECKNQGLEGKRHPETGVEFVRKVVDAGNGELVEGVFPKFDYVFEAKISPELYDLANTIQFKEAGKQLMGEIENNFKLKKLFSIEQIEQLKDGLAPDGYVWHHNEEAGILQLVDWEEHYHTGHTGGRSIWGGGYR